MSGTNGNADGLWTPLMEAATGGRAELVESLVNAGAPVNARSATARNKTALHCAIASGDLATVLAVLPHADLTLEDDEGHDALMAALREEKSTRAIVHVVAREWLERHGVAADVSHNEQMSNVRQSNRRHRNGNETRC